MLASFVPTLALRPRPIRPATLFAVFLAAVAGPACHDAAGPKTSNFPVPSFSVISGNGQSAIVGSELPQPLVARATTSTGTPIAGLTVFFVVTQGGGHLFAGGGVTNSSGNVEDYWTIGTIAGGQQTVEVRAVDPTTGTKNTYATFTANAHPGPPAIIKIGGGDGQTAFTRALLPIKPAALVTDVFGNPISGVPVTFAVSGGGGSISGGAATTGPGGLATVTYWRMGRGPGTNTLTATKTGLAGSPLTFIATAKFGLSVVAPGDTHTCGLSAANDVYCWGLNSVGGVGDGTFTNRSAPVRLGGGLLLPTSLALGDAHSCALLSAGNAYCWGLNHVGQLGDGSTTNSNLPVAVSGGVTFKSIVALDVTTCGLTAAGAVWCWGYNGIGEFGNGTNTNSSVPVPAAGGITFKSIHAGYLFMCGLTSTGTAWCWGDNRSGALGNGTTTNSNTPVLVGGGLTFTSLALGGYHACGLIPGGAAYCWGNNVDGEIGDQTSLQRLSPTPVAGGFAFTQLTAGYEYTCGINSTGVAYCWGKNDIGQLGLGVVSTTPSFVPALVVGGRHFASISAAGGAGHTCGLPVGGGAPLCWGYGRYGQLGNGGTLNVPLPVEVVPPPVP